MSFPDPRRGLRIGGPEFPTRLERMVCSVHGASVCRCVVGLIIILIINKPRPTLSVHIGAAHPIYRSVDEPMPDIIQFVVFAAAAVGAGDGVNDGGERYCRPIRQCLHHVHLTSMFCAVYTVFI